MSEYRGYRGGGRGGGGYGGGGYRRDQGHPYRRPDDRPPQPRQPENPSAAVSRQFIRLADAETFDTQEDLPRLARYIASNWPASKQGLLDGFRISVSENPHKLPYYAALLLLLSRDEHQPAASVEQAAAATGDVDMTAADPALEPLAGDANAAESSKAASERVHVVVLRHLAESLDEWLKAREWIKVRLTIQFLAHLVPLELVSPDSFTALLNSLCGVIRTITGKGRFDLASVDDRADRLVRIVTEALLRSGSDFYDANADIVQEMVATIRTYADARREAIDGRALCNVIQRDLSSVATLPDNIENCLSVLERLRDRSFAPPAFLPSPFKRFPRSLEEERPAMFEIPLIAIPEAQTDDLRRLADGEGCVSPIYALNEVGLTDGRIPDPSDPDGWVMRALILDIVQVYEVNRIECASLLVRLPDFVLPDTFIPPPPRPAPGESAPVPAPGEWVRQSTTINVIVSAMLASPHAPHKLLYYVALLAQLCMLEKNEMAPPLGLAFKTLYSKLGQGMDAEVTQRAAEWLALHLSNFAFSWLWKEWVPDLDLDYAHPKKAFMKRVIDQEIRLSYHDRILSTLPGPFAEDGGLISAEPLEEDYKFRSNASDDASEYLDDAQDLLDMVRRREPAEDVLARLRRMASISPEDPIPPAYCEVATHVLLELGKGAFAHHLRVLERYLTVFKALASTSEDRQQLLASSVDFWKHNVQQQVIVFGKFHFYSILDSSDIVTFVFSRLNASVEDIEDGRETSWTSGQAWDLLKVALEQQFGFAIGSRRKAHKLATEDEEAKNRKEGLNGDVADAANSDAMAVDSAPSQAARTAASNASRLRRDLDTVLIHTTTCFIKSLVPAFYAGEDMTASTSKLDDLLALGAGEDLDERGTWDTRARFGWFREFLRLYARPLQRVADRIEAVLGSLPSRTDAEAEPRDWRLQSGYAVRLQWEMAVGETRKGVAVEAAAA